MVFSDEIESMLPYGKDFIFIDSVEIINSKRAIGYKTIREDEFWVKDHFPSKPMYPAAFMLESLGQTAGVLMMKTTGLKDKEENIRAFGGATEIKHMKFYRAIHPHQEIICDVEIVRGSLRHPLWTIQGTITVDDNICCRATVNAAYFPQKNCKKTTNTG
jgi:3-hydroxyacyl-[acyl-carrier-protein] dehydratase